LFRDDLQCLASLPAPEQQHVWQEFLKHGRDAFAWAGEEKLAGFRVPFEPKLLARAVYNRVGPRQAAKAWRALAKLLGQKACRERGKPNGE
jgi:hypothetical protein